MWALAGRCAGTVPGYPYLINVVTSVTAPPVLTSISPNSVSKNAGTQVISLVGSGFLGDKNGTASVGRLQEQAMPTV